MVEFDVAQLSSVQVYQLITRIVAPRPIAFVSSLSAQGKGNLAPFSYFNAGGSHPQSVVFCPVNNRYGEVKDTVRNIEQTGEYVINVVTREMAERMNQASWVYPYGVDEFDECGFTRAPSRIVKPPRVQESPIQMEVRLFQIVRHGSGPLASNYIIGEVVYLHIHESVMTDGMPDNRKIHHIGRLGGDYYTEVTPDSLFELSRPQGPAPLREPEGG